MVPYVGLESEKSHENWNLVELFSQFQQVHVSGYELDSIDKKIQNKKGNDSCRNRVNSLCEENIVQVKETVDGENKRQEEVKSQYINTQF